MKVINLALIGFACLNSVDATISCDEGDEKSGGKYTETATGCDYCDMFLLAKIVKWWRCGKSTDFEKEWPAANTADGKWCATGKATLRNYGSKIYVEQANEDALELWSEISESYTDYETYIDEVWYEPYFCFCSTDNCNTYNNIELMSSGETAIQYVKADETGYFTSGANALALSSGVAILLALLN